MRSKSARPELSGKGRRLALQTAKPEPSAHRLAPGSLAAIDEDASRADQRINGFLEQYYGQPAAVLRKRQACYAGPAAGAAAFLQAYADAGADHLIVRFTGEHDRNLEALAGLRAQLGW